MDKNRERPSALLRLLYPEQKRAPLAVLQGDTAGKDGAIRHAITGMNL